MAYVQMPYGKELRGSLLGDATAKQAHVPQKTKQKTFNINHLLDQEMKLRKRRDQASHVLSPKDPGIKKMPGGKWGFFARYHQQERKPASAAKEHPQTDDPEILAQYEQQKEERSVINGLSETLEPYIEDMIATWRAKLHQQDLYMAALRRGEDLDGNPIERPGVPSREDFAALARELETLNRPVDDETVNIQFPQPDGSNKVKTLRVGDIKAKFFQRYERKMKQREELEEQHALIEAEIEQAKMQAQCDSEAREIVAREHEAEIQALQREVVEIEERAKKDKAKLRKQERDVAKAFNMKIQELWDSMA